MCHLGFIVDQSWKSGLGRDHQEPYIPLLCGLTTVGEAILGTQMKKRTMLKVPLIHIIPITV